MVVLLIGHQGPAMALMAVCLAVEEIESTLGGLGDLDGLSAREPINGCIHAAKREIHEILQGVGNMGD